MAALDRVDVLAGSNLPSVAPSIIKRIAGKAIWDWFDEHKGEVLVERKVLFFSIKLTIGDLVNIGGNIIERIAGPRPFPR